MSTGLPPAVAAVREYRKAARLIVRSNRPQRERLRALIRLAERARSTGAGILVQQAVWEESKRFIRSEPEPPPVRTNDPVEDAIRRQRGEGRERCKACLRSLPTIEMLDRNRRERITELERRQLFEEAGQ